MSHPAVIASVGLCCPIGRSFSEASVAYAHGRKGLKKYPEIIGQDGLPQTLSCVLSPVEERNYVNRLHFLFNQAFEDCLKRSPDLSKIGLKKYRLLLALPNWMQGTPYFSEFMKLVIANPPIGLSKIEICYALHAESLALVVNAHAAIAEGKERALFVAGLDSFISPKILDYVLTATNVLTRKNPYGFVPGEACAVLLIARQEDYLEGANIFATGTHTEEVDLEKNTSALLGQGLGLLLNDISKIRFKETPPKRVLVDLNGNRWRAEQYGFALANGGHALGSAAQDPECHAITMGELGAATGAVLTSLSLMPGPPQSSDSTKPPSGNTLIITSDRDGPSVVIVVGE